MRIIVFGSTGMLGRYVYEYFSRRHYDVIGSTRKDIDVSNTSKVEIMARGLRSSDVVINCAGLIKQRKNVSTLDFVMVNTAFPHQLSAACKAVGCGLIHITTDCVFSGGLGSYTEDSVHDETDIYGRSKSLGEPEDATVIRTSIIGEELTGFLSLLEWVKSNTGKEVQGYTDHFWNGITCLQFAEICEYIIEKKLFWKGVKHVFSPEVVSKYELVKLISKVYDLNVSVIGHETGTICDKSLATVREDVSIDVPELERQLIIMKQFGGYKNVRNTTHER